MCVVVNTKETKEKKQPPTPCNQTDINRTTTERKKNQTSQIANTTVRRHRIMFNTLASYLLGSSTVKSPTDTEPINENQVIQSIADDQPEDQPQPQQQQAIKFNLITTNCVDEDEDDWLLVDREGEGSSAPQTDSEEEIPFVEIKNNPVIRTRHSRNNSAAGSHDGTFSMLPSSPVPNSMDESWYVTPPPCFTSTGPVNVETSPLENLLIEHPR